MTQMSTDHLWGSTQVKTLSRTNELKELSIIENNLNHRLSTISYIISDAEELSCFSYNDFYVEFLVVHKDKTALCDYTK